MGGVSTQLGKIDRDKARHYQLKTAPTYNARQKALRLEKKERAATDSELIARAEAQKQKTRAKQRHYYSAKKQLLYEAEEKKKGGGAVAKETVVAARGPAAEVVKRKRGRPRNAVQPEEDKENDAQLHRQRRGRRCRLTLHWSQRAHVWRGQC